jgi:hypothetical protein
LRALFGALEEWVRTGTAPPPSGLSQANAEKRVDEVITKKKADPDAARKAGAYLSIFTAVSMLIGAFIAAAAAALGGRHRDEDWRVRSELLR